MGTRYAWPSMTDERRETMTGDETRRLLKVFGVAVTDAEAEAERLAERAARLTQGSPAREVAALLRTPATCCGNSTPGGSRSPSGCSPCRAGYRANWPRRRRSRRGRMPSG